MATSYFVQLCLEVLLDMFLGLGPNTATQEKSARLQTPLLHLKTYLTEKVVSTTAQGASRAKQMPIGPHSAL